MKRIAELIGRELEWTQPSALKMQYELRAGNEVAATLRFRSSLGSFATAESADGCWTFKRVGFLQTKVTIRACSGDNEIAVFKNNTWKGGGTLELPDGKRILATTNFWQTNLEFRNESGQTLTSALNVIMLPCLRLPISTRFASSPSSPKTCTPLLIGSLAVA